MVGMSQRVIDRGVRRGVCARTGAAVVMTGVNLALAVLLLAALVWRVGSKTAPGSLIVAAGAGFALARGVRSNGP